MGTVEGKRLELDVTSHKVRYELVLFFQIGFESRCVGVSYHKDNLDVVVLVIVVYVDKELRHLGKVLFGEYLGNDDLVQIEPIIIVQIANTLYAS